MARAPFFSIIRRGLLAALEVERAGIPLASTAEYLEERTESAAMMRRTFLGRGAAAAAMFAASPLASGCATSTPKSTGGRGAMAEGAMSSGAGGAGEGEGKGGSRDREESIGIVGAGLAGMVAAYRLRALGFRVRVFEAATRVGGRTFSTRRGLIDGQVAELGGELIDSNHVTMHRLAKELSLDVDDLLGDEPKNGFRRDVFWFGGRFISDKALIESFRPLARSMAACVDRVRGNPSSFAALDRMSLAEWLDAQSNTSPLIREILRVAYVGEYGLEADEQSVLNLLELINYEDEGLFRLFGESDERFHIRGGNDQIATRLAERLQSQIETSSRLLALGRDGGRYRLTFERDRGRYEEVFDAVVLALPFTMLRLVEGLDDIFRPDKLRVVRELGYGTNAKLMAQFRERVWRVKHNASGSAVTDNGRQTIWDTSRRQDGAAGVLTNFLGGRAGVEVGRGSAEEQLELALPQLDAIFPGLSGAYLKGSALRMHWPSAPFALGSYPCYRPGQWSFAGIEGRTEDERLFFAGDHCSADFQGFMEGAAESGEAAAHRVALAFGAVATTKQPSPVSEQALDIRERAVTSPSDRCMEPGVWYAKACFAGSRRC
ncbi:MAG: FAD-dependent oxidoreductase [Deltaproteobacteria bacterium]|nr:FAD-dependent oxidoreductase [Deltaproteobacteria bacterium]